MAVRMGPLGKVFKKYVTDQKHQKDGNSQVVPTLIRDGGIGSGGNHCQKDTSCQWWQGWDHMGRRTRNASLMRSRRTSIRYLECQSGKVLQEVTGFTANGGF